MPIPILGNWFYTYQSPEKLKERGFEMVEDRDVPALVQVRVDALAQPTKPLNCKKGVTIPCGRVCRRPENCKEPRPEPTAPQQTSQLELVQRKIAEKKAQGGRARKPRAGKASPAPTTDPSGDDSPAPPPQKSVKGRGRVRSAKEAIDSGKEIGSDLLTLVTRPNPELDRVLSLRNALQKGTPEGVKIIDSKIPTMGKLMDLKDRATSPEVKDKVDQEMRRQRGKVRKKYLDKIQEKEAELGRAEVAAAQRLIDDLIETSSVSQEDAEAMVDSIGLTNVPEAHRQEMVKFMRLTNGQAMDSLRSVTMTPGRGAARPWEGTVAYDGEISTLYHEMAHHIEFSAMNEDGRFAREWVKSRASGKPKKLAEITGNTKYGDDEIAYPDEFISPYVGKTYKHKGMLATEVYSMGIEHFHSPQALSAFARRDPEHFAMVLGAMRQRPQGSAVRSIRGPETRSNPINPEKLVQDLTARGLEPSRYKDLESRYISSLPPDRRSQLMAMPPQARIRAIGRDVLAMIDNFNKDSNRCSRLP